LGVYFVSIFVSGGKMLKVIAVGKNRPKQMPDEVWDQYIRMKHPEVQKKTDLLEIYSGTQSFVLNKYLHSKAFAKKGALSLEAFVGEALTQTRIDLIWDSLEPHEQCWLKCALLMCGCYLDENYKPPPKTRVEGNVVYVKSFKRA
jgi:hypothetical protein